MSTTTLFTGRDILAAENHLRCVAFRDALVLLGRMPREIVVRLAAHVGADVRDPAAIVTRARMPYAER